MGLVISVFLYVKGVYAEPLQALRYGMFNTISMATTTGYANTDFAQWPLFAPLTMLLLSGFATSAGSTGGGIKMIRAILLIKQARNELVTMLHPHAVSPVRINGRAVEARTMASVLAFMLFYGLSIAVFTSLLLLSGLDPITASRPCSPASTTPAPGWARSAPWATSPCCPTSRSGSAPSPC